MAASSEKLTFPGSQGGFLAARLDRPDGIPKAYALFAHCFTCSKDIFAASRIAGALAARGFAVLRFDFTGLGASDGEFANTNFSSNVEDLLAAVDYLRRMHAAPQVLIGHSLGGAAVLAAAGEVPEVKAVATIGAPSDADHVVDNFAAKIDEIEDRGAAEVSLAGRPFTIKRQFLDDIRGQRLAGRISAMNKALIIFHAPGDEIVGIDNAASIFTAARHPKSFISLDQADHLLHDRADAVYVANVLSAWVSRYISADESDRGIEAPDQPGVIRVGETRSGKFQQEAFSGPHRLFVDEPVDYGGDDTGPSPYDYLSIALAACTSMTLRMYGDRKGYALESVNVDVSHSKVHADDCAACSQGGQGQIDQFERTLHLTGSLGEDERHRLLEIADKCPVHKTVVKGAHVTTTMKDS